MTSVAETMERLRLDRAHGAGWLAREAVRGLAHAAEAYPADTSSDLLAYLRRTARAFALARPSMAPLANIVALVLDRVLARADGASVADVHRLVRSAAEEAARMSEEASNAAAAQARRYLSGTMITHSYSSSILAALIGARDRIEHVVVTESRPLYEGRATARELAAAGIPVSLITDAQMGVFMQEARVAVVGADSVLEDGSVVNKAGTSLLALAARAAGTPFYVVAETLKIAPWPARDVHMEENDAGEVAPDVPAGVRVRNIYFDRTPARLVTGLVTERGALTRRQVREMARAHRARFKLVMGGGR